MRQFPSRYAFDAGRNLPDKEFRYLRTIIVIADVHWRFGDWLAPLPLTFQHWSGVSPHTSPYGFAETCVFGKQSPGIFRCSRRSASEAPTTKLQIPNKSQISISKCSKNNILVIWIWMLGFIWNLDFGIWNSQCEASARHLPKLRLAVLPSSLTRVLPFALGYSPSPPVSVLSTDAILLTLEVFPGTLLISVLQHF